MKDKNFNQSEGLMAISEDWQGHKTQISKRII